MGGLTVLKALRSRLPQADYLYLGDTARLPYGTKSPSTVKRYAEQAAAVLVERGVSALVIACNTASGIALEHLQKTFAPLPVFGVVEPGARAACEVMDDTGVLVLATESTVEGGAYQKALSALSEGIHIRSRACPLWVTLAEQGISDGQLTRVIIEHDLAPYLDDGPNTLLLGCTHFPVFSPFLQAQYPNHHIVDSAATTAQAVGLALDPDGHGGQGHSQTTFLATDGISRFQRVGSYFLGEEIASVELIDL